MAQLGQHDIWMSLLAGCVSKVAVLAEPLVAYRQHPAQWGANFTFLKRSELAKSVQTFLQGDPKTILPTKMAACLCERVAALDGVIRQAAVLARAAREQAASLDPARVRAQVAEAEAARRRAEAAAVTSEARAAETTTEAQAQAEAPEAAREDARAAQAGTGAAPSRPARRT